MALLQCNFVSSSLMRTVPFHAILPVDKVFADQEHAVENKPFPTLYLLHGIFGNDLDWVTGTRIRRYAEEKNLAVVMPSGDNGFYVDHPGGDRYGEFIGKELVDVTRRMFPLSKKREETFLAGLSMGGYGALRNGLNYPETFGYAAGLSSAFILDLAAASGQDSDSERIPAHGRSYYESVFGDLTKLKGSDRDPEALVKNLKKSQKRVPKLYLACGTDDPLLDANRAFHNFLKEQGVEHTYEEGPGAHEWDFWDRMIKRVIDWLPLGKSVSGINSGNVV